jgi:hypothetical protein
MFKLLYILKYEREYLISPYTVHFNVTKKLNYVKLSATLINEIRLTLNAFHAYF